MFSIKNLERSLQVQNTKQKIHQPSSILSAGRSLQQREPALNEFKHETIVEQLLKPELNRDQLPGSWKMKKEKKKKSRTLHL